MNRIEIHIQVPRGENKLLIDDRLGEPSLILYPVKVLQCRLRMDILRSIRFLQYPIPPILGAMIKAKK